MWKINKYTKNRYIVRRRATLAVVLTHVSSTASKGTTDGVLVVVVYSSSSRTTIQHGTGVCTETVGGARLVVV